MQVSCCIIKGQIRTLTLGGRPLILRFRLASGGRLTGVWIHFTLIALGLKIPRAEPAQRLH